MNLFIDAMPEEKLGEIEKIRRNKAFTLRLLDDIKQVFHVFSEVRDSENSVQVYLNCNDSRRFANCTFSASKLGITFRTKVLGYRSLSEESKKRNPNIKELGPIFDKYKDKVVCGGGKTTAESGFLSEHGHGNVEFLIEVPDENSSNLKEVLRDIIFLMERESFRKKF